MGGPNLTDCSPRTRSLGSHRSGDLCTPPAWVLPPHAGGLSPVPRVKKQALRQVALPEDLDQTGL